ncbi:MAG: tRNA pseudouridine(55) synthase TruB [Acidaminococcaceae bacterium]|jgi:tRNA pseudouridine55 synthase|nr:tRNA pseudouridine(55) synthase TruB [Acidaminococcaceae bacterium]
MNSGILNVLKVPGMTSQDVVNIVRGIYKTKKVGHAGTLDPDAAGVLPVFLGEATKLLEYALENQKCYRAEALLGQATNTGDDSGSVKQVLPVPVLDAAAVRQTLQGFLGAQQQIPPMYSALKLNGKKLYQYAREGKEIVRAPREIFIQKLELVEMALPRFTVEVVCSRGTYIRTLLEDIGQALQTCATMTFLLRLQAGTFTLDTAHTLEEIEQAPAEYLLPPAAAVQHLPRLEVNPLQAYRITCGVKTTVFGSKDGIQALYSQEQFLGVVRVEQEKVQALKILAKPAFKSEGK